MFLIDASGRIVWCNAAFQEMIGRRKQIVGQDVRELLSPTSKDLLSGSEGKIKDNLHLLFLGDDHTSHTLTCRVLAVDEYTLVLSERVLATETAVMQHMTVLNNELSNLTRELHQKNVALERAMAEIKVLRGILPICMHCKKIRDDKGYWTQLEAYISDHTDSQFSHGICDVCLNKLYPDVAEKLRKEESEK
jgi:PAS domain-containing protein